MDLTPPVGAIRARKTWTLARWGFFGWWVRFMQTSNVFRRLTIPCGRERSYVVSDCARGNRLLLFRCPGELRQQSSTTYTHEAGETSIDFSTVVGSLCISSVPLTPSMVLVSDFAA